MGDLVEKRVFVRLPALAVTAADSANMVYAEVQLWDDDEFGDNIMHTLVHAEVFVPGVTRIDSSSIPSFFQRSTFSLQDTIPFAQTGGMEIGPIPQSETVMWMETHMSQTALTTTIFSSTEVFPTEELGFQPTLRTPAQYVYPVISYIGQGADTTGPELNAIFYFVFERTTINDKEWASEWIAHRQSQLYDFLEVSGRIQTAVTSSEFPSVIDGGRRRRMNVASVFTANDDAETMLTQAGYVAQYQDVHTMSTQTGALGLTIDPENWGRMAEGIPSTFWDYEKVPIRYDAATNQQVMVSQ